MSENKKEKESPLAARLRPQTLEEVVGQEDIKEYFRSIGKDPERYSYIDPAESGRPEKPWEHN